VELVHLVHHREIISISEDVERPWLTLLELSQIWHQVPG
jgi:hypothetical protein